MENVLKIGCSCIECGSEAFLKIPNYNSIYECFVCGHPEVYEVNTSDFIIYTDEYLSNYIPERKALLKEQL